MTARPFLWLGAGVFFACIAVLALLGGLPAAQDHERVGGNRTMDGGSPETALASDVGGREPSGDAEDGQSDHDSVPPPAETLEQLRRDVPTADSADLPLLRYSTGRVTRSPWKVDILVDLCGNDLFDAPPYCCRWMYGEKDRAWLEALHRCYRREVTAATLRQYGPGEIDEARRIEIEDRARPPYRELVREVARSRLESAPTLVDRFRDPRSIRELSVRLPTGNRDPQYVWLREVVDGVVPGELLQVGLNEAADFGDLSATDLAEVVRLSLDLEQAYRRPGNALSTPEERDRFYRPFAERLQVILAAKRPAEDSE